MFYILKQQLEKLHLSFLLRITSHTRIYKFIYVQFKEK